LVIDEACHQCAKGAVKPSFSIRLALASLYALGDGDKSMFEDFWKEMQREEYPHASPTHVVYRRVTYTRTHYNRIARSVGVELTPDFLARMDRAKGKHERAPSEKI
ncbi:MAG: hypothetical protein J0G94_00780, partial [Sphingomonadales bacterium]|nr:hypothetical protein [Sphingomonadales bacterium]